MKNNVTLLSTDTESSLIVALDSINDPGNLGTIMRTCYWFGVNEVLIGSGSAEIYNSKVIRASQGAIFNLNISAEVNLEIELKKFYEKDFHIILTDPAAESDLSDYSFSSDQKYVLVFGNEANGISENILGHNKYTKIRIKAYSGCESLNIAVAAGIILNSIKNK